MAITYHAGRRIQGLATDGTAVTNWSEASGTNGTGAGQYDSSNTSGDNSFNYDTTNSEIDFNVVRTSNTPNCMMKDITSSTNGLGEALSTTNWRMRFKIYWDNWEDQGDITLHMGLCSFPRSEATNGGNSNDIRKPTGGDIIGLQFCNAKLSNNCWNFLKFFYGENEDETSRFGGDSTNNAVDLEVANTILSSGNYNCNVPTDDTYYWCEIIRSGSTITFNCSTTAYGNSDVCGASNSNTGKTTSGTATTTFGTTRPLKYFYIGKTGGTGETEPIQGMIRDLQIQSTNTGVKPTDVQVGSRYEETDTRKMYHYNEYTINTFTTTGNSTFAVTGSGDVEYLVVAGGGAGSNYGGGGAGGLRTATGFGVTAQSYTITVGAGGTGGTTGTNGSNSIFSTITSTGGGRGGVGNTATGASGGSGGGGGYGTNGGAGTSGQGNIGGNGYVSSPYAGAGGGGKTGEGVSGASGGGGNGGAGISSSISGTATFYSGGGGGGTHASGSGGDGGTGGGGNGGQNTSGTAGGVNTGGGGAGYGDSAGSGTNGGSGIVIIKYLTGSITATGGTITTEKKWEEEGT